MRRRLFNILSAVSLVLCVATIATSVRSRSRGNQLRWATRHATYFVTVSGGDIMLLTTNRWHCCHRIEAAGLGTMHKVEEQPPPEALRSRTDFSAFRLETDCSRRHRRCRITSWSFRFGFSHCCWRSRLLAGYYGAVVGSRDTALAAAMTSAPPPTAARSAAPLPTRIETPAKLPECAGRVPKPIPSGSARWSFWCFCWLKLFRIRCVTDFIVISPALRMFPQRRSARDQADRCRFCPGIFRPSAPTSRRIAYPAVMV